VAGINTLKAHFRQAANYSIPVARIQSFLDASLKKGQVDERALLDTRLDSFIEGLKGSKAVYPHIATYLSNACAGENAEFAISEMFSKAGRATQDDIFGNLPVEVMRQAVAWLIENRIRSKTGNINITTESVTANDDGNDTGYTVIFKINDKMFSSEWVNEYGIWRIYKFGEFAAGNKEFVKAKDKARANEEALHSEPGAQISAGLVYILDRGPCFGLDFAIKSSKYFGYGLQPCFGKDFFQGVMFLGVYVPIKLGSAAALTPFVTGGIGAQFKETGKGEDSWG
jgi:hypothetical protein